MITINNESQPIVTPLGRALHNARLAASLSLEEVATHLNLNVSTVKDLEIDLPETIENNKYAAIYLRGYLTNYARLVCLSSLEQYIEYQQLSNPGKSTRQLRNTSSANTKLKKRPKFIAAMLIGISVIIFSGIAVQQQWLSDKLPDFVTNRDTEVTAKSNVQVATVVVENDTLPENGTVSENETVSESDTLPENGTVSENDTLSENATVSENEINTTVIEQPLTEVEAIQDVNTTVESVETVIVQTEQQTVQETSFEAEIINTPDITEEILVTNEVAENISNDNDIIETDESIENEVIAVESLNLSFSGDSWTEIFDVTGERLAYGLYTEGNVLIVKGREPFQLKLGNPSVVEIHYQDNKIERELPAGRTARLTIP